jgi:CYTH domain-containing protein
LIELGAGTGQFTRLVASLARDVEAVDTSPEVLELNAAKVPAPNVPILVGDGEPAERVARMSRTRDRLRIHDTGDARGAVIEPSPVMPPRLDHPDAPPGKAAKYARPELERRFLLRGVPPLETAGRHRIEDRYLEGTRLRLRRMTSTDGQGEVTIARKLTQKIPAADGGPGLITNIYLSPEEYARLQALPARELAKTRLSIPPFGVDVFEGQLDGLIVAEVEFETRSEADAFVPGIDVVAEVTSDVRFTGGCLVSTTAAELAELLRAFGLV